MVFWSGIQILSGYSLSRSLITGTRSLTRALLFQELILGVCCVLPLSALLAYWTVRLALRGKGIWTTTFILTVIGDLVLEVLLPSLDCYPPLHADFHSDVDLSLANDEEMSLVLWLARTWGWSCPDISHSSRRFTPEVTGSLLMLRLTFTTLGLAAGESMVWVAITGGIASGKSTVVRLLTRQDSNASAADFDHAQGGGGSNGGSANSSNNSKRRRRKAGSDAGSSSSSSSSSSRNRSTATGVWAYLSTWIFSQNEMDEDDEGTFFVVDADTISHDILLPPLLLASKSSPLYPSDSVYPQILQTFGDPSCGCRNILNDDGIIDRTKLGAVVFTDPVQRSRLNRITHPRIFYILIRRLLWDGMIWSNRDVVAADMPLLYESGSAPLFGLIVCVACSPEVQLERLRQRNPDLSVTECQARIDSQWDVDRKTAAADVVIWNNGDREELRVAVEQARQEVMARLYGGGLSLYQTVLLVGGALSLAISSNIVFG